jgi:hypothetical protein
MLSLLEFQALNQALSTRVSCSTAPLCVLEHEVVGRQQPHALGAQVEIVSKH